MTTRQSKGTLVVSGSRGGQESTLATLASSAQGMLRDLPTYEYVTQLAGPVESCAVRRTQVRQTLNVGAVDVEHRTMTSPNGETAVLVTRSMLAPVVFSRDAHPAQRQANARGEGVLLTATERYAAQRVGKMESLARKIAEIKALRTKISTLARKGQFEMYDERLKKTVSVAEALLGAHEDIISVDDFLQYTEFSDPKTLHLLTARVVEAQAQENARLGKRPPEPVAYSAESAFTMAIGLIMREEQQLLDFVTAAETRKRRDKTTQDLIRGAEDALKAENLMATLRVEIDAAEKTGIRLPSWAPLLSQLLVVLAGLLHYGFGVRALHDAFGVLPGPAVPGTGTTVTTLAIGSLALVASESALLLPLIPEWRLASDARRVVARGPKATVGGFVLRVVVGVVTGAAREFARAPLRATRNVVQTAAGLGLVGALGYAGWWLTSSAFSMARAAFAPNWTDTLPEWLPSGGSLSLTFDGLFVGTVNVYVLAALASAVARAAARLVYDFDFRAASMRGGFVRLASAASTHALQALASFFILRTVVDRQLADRAGAVPQAEIENALIADIALAAVGLFASLGGGGAPTPPGGERGKEKEKGREKEMYEEKAERRGRAIVLTKEQAKQIIVAASAPQWSGVGLRIIGSAAWIAGGAYGTGVSLATAFFEEEFTTPVAEAEAFRNAVLGYLSATSAPRSRFLETTVSTADSPGIAEREFQRSIAKTFVAHVRMYVFTMPDANAESRESLHRAVLVRLNELSDALPRRIREMIYDKLVAAGAGDVIDADEFDRLRRAAFDEATEAALARHYHDHWYAKRWSYLRAFNIELKKMKQLPNASPVGAFMAVARRALSSEAGIGLLSGVMQTAKTLVPQLALAAVTTYKSSVLEYVPRAVKIAEQAEAGLVGVGLHLVADVATALVDPTIGKMLVARTLAAPVIGDYGAYELAFLTGASLVLNAGPSAVAGLRIAASRWEEMSAAARVDIRAVSFSGIGAVESGRIPPPLATGTGDLQHARDLAKTYETRLEQLRREYSDAGRGAGIVAFATSASDVFAKLRGKYRAETSRLAGADNRTKRKLLYRAIVLGIAASAAYSIAGGRSTASESSTAVVALPGSSDYDAAGFSTMQPFAYDGTDGACAVATDFDTSEFLSVSTATSLPASAVAPVQRATARPSTSAAKVQMFVPNSRWHEFEAAVRKTAADPAFTSMQPDAQVAALTQIGVQYVERAVVRPGTAIEPLGSYDPGNVLVAAQNRAAGALFPHLGVGSTVADAGRAIKGILQLPDPAKSPAIKDWQFGMRMLAHPRVSLAAVEALPREYEGVLQRSGADGELAAIGAARSRLLGALVDEVFVGQAQLPPGDDLHPFNLATRVGVVKQNAHVVRLVAERLIETHPVHAAFMGRLFVELVHEWATPVGGADLADTVARFRLAEGAPAPSGTELRDVLVVMLHGNPHFVLRTAPVKRYEDLLAATSQSVSARLALLRSFVIVPADDAAVAARAQLPLLAHNIEHLALPERRRVDDVKERAASVRAWHDRTVAALGMPKGTMLYATSGSRDIVVDADGSVNFSTAMYDRVLAALTRRVARPTVAKEILVEMLTIWLPQLARLRAEQIAAEAALARAVAYWEARMQTLYGKPNDGVVLAGSGDSSGVVPDVAGLLGMASDASAEPVARAVTPGEWQRIVNQGSVAEGPHVPAASSGSDEDADVDFDARFETRGTGMLAVPEQIGRSVSLRSGTIVVVPDLSDYTGGDVELRVIGTVDAAPVRVRPCELAVSAGTGMVYALVDPGQKWKCADGTATGTGPQWRVAALPLKSTNSFTTTPEDTYQVLAAFTDATQAARQFDAVLDIYAKLDPEQREDVPTPDQHRGAFLLWALEQAPLAAFRETYQTQIRLVIATADERGMTDSGDLAILTAAVADINSLVDLFCQTLNVRAEKTWYAPVTNTSVLLQGFFDYSEDKRDAARAEQSAKQKTAYAPEPPPSADPQWSDYANYGIGAAAFALFAGYWGARRPASAASLITPPAIPPVIPAAPITTATSSSTSSPPDVEPPPQPAPVVAPVRTRRAPVQRRSPSPVRRRARAVEGGQTADHLSRHVSTTRAPPTRGWLRIPAGMHLRVQTSRWARVADEARVCAAVLDPVMRTFTYLVDETWPDEGAGASTGRLPMRRQDAFFARALVRATVSADDLLNDRVRDPFLRAAALAIYATHPYEQWDACAEMGGLAYREWRAEFENPGVAYLCGRTHVPAPDATDAELLVYIFEHARLAVARALGPVWHMTKEI